MNPTTYFWNWFSENNKHFLNYLNLSPKLQHHYTFWLEWHLSYYAKGLNYIIIFPKNKQLKVKMIITANGKPEFFEKVQQVVANAPKFSKWEIVAFVQPTANIQEIIAGIDKPLVFQDISLKISGTRFKVTKTIDFKKIDIVVYVNYETISDDYNDLFKVVYIMIESILGEKLLQQNINRISLVQLSKNDFEPLELYKLKYYINSLSGQF